MKVLLNIDNNIQLNENDLLVYKKGKFTPIAIDFLLKNCREENENRKSDDKALLDKIEALEHRIYLLELENKYNAGEITKEEYEKCLGK